MSTSQEPLISLQFEALDDLLAQHPFGNSEYVIGQLHACYCRRLAKIATRLPIARQLLDALSNAEPYHRYRAIGDTVLRCAVQHAHVQVESSEPYGLRLDQCEEVFRETIRFLSDAKEGLIGSALVSRLGSDCYHGWIWSEECPETVFTRTFRVLVHDNYRQRLCTPSAEEREMLLVGTRLLARLLPRSSRSALAHTHLVAVFPQEGAWATTLSSSEFRLSGTIFLNRGLLFNPWKVAEHLFHEALHQQLYDVRQGHLLLDPNFTRDDAPLIQSLWNMPDSTRGNFWDIHRSLAAFHVYVYLSLLTTVAGQRPDLEEEYGPVTMVGRRTALVRAHYLNEQIRKLCWQELGVAGRRIVDWLSSILELLDPTPPAEGACIHLLLDRYWREARAIASLVGAAQPAELHTRLARLIEQEVESARHVLAEVREDIGPLDTAMSSFASEDPVTRFLSIRTLIAETILNVSPSSYTLSSSRVADEMVRDMVETSSEEVQTLLAR